VIGLLVVLATLQIDSLPPITIEASVDNSQLVVGEQFTLAVNVTQLSMEGHISVSPLRLPQMEGIESSGFNSSSSQIMMENGQTIMVRTSKFGLVATEPGTLFVSPITVEYNDPQTGAIQKMASDPIQVVVTQEKSKHNPIGTSNSAAEGRKPSWLLLLVSLVVVGVGGFFFYRYIKEMPSDSTQPETQPEKPLNKLAGLDITNTAPDQLYAEFRNLLTEAVSLKLNYSFKDNTTNEMLKILKEKQVTNTIFDLSKRVLDSCDQVRFARSNPTAEERQMTFESLKLVLDMINASNQSEGLK
jgi:hypothetical protein